MQETTASLPSKTLGRPPDTSPFKKCTTCGEEKPRTAEFFCRRGINSWRSKCKACHAQMVAKQRKANPDRTRDIHKAFYARHKEKRLGEVQAYREENRDTINSRRRELRAANPELYRERDKARQKYKNEFMRKLRKERPEYRLRNVLNARLAFCLAYPDRPSNVFVERFGYQPKALREHLERCFTGKMSWDNYGDLWEVDHIIPVSSFKLPEEIRRCWALTNLRPLLRVENRKKSNKITHLI